MTKPSRSYSYFAAIPLLGIVSLMGFAGIANASETDGSEATPCMEYSHEYLGQKENLTEKRMERHNNAALADNAEEMQAILESQDFDAFVALVANHGSQNEELTEERLEQLQERFARMIERHADGSYLESEPQTRQRMHKNQTEK